MFSLLPSMSNDRAYSRRWPALFVLSMALVMVVAANTSLTVAVTDIQQKLHAMTSQTRWILDAYPVAVSLAVIGLGAGAWLANLADAVLNGTPLQASGVAGATGDAAVELGSALGIALLGSVLTSGYHSRLPAAVSQLPAAAHTAVSDGLLGAHAVAAKLPALQGHRLVSAAGSAFVHGLTLAAIVAAGIALAGALLAIRMPRHATAASDETSQIDAHAVMEDVPVAA